MNFQNVIKSLKSISYFNVVNYYKPIFEKKLKSILLNKKKIHLRNSNNSNYIFNKFFGKNLDFNELHKIFFNKEIFNYSISRERSKIIEILKHNHLDSLNKYTEFADQIISREFIIFEKKHEFKENIDWHYSFFEDYKWKLEKSEEINIRPKYKSQNIDVKYVWELNRHQFLPYLGFAYYITKNEKYAIEFKKLILDWIENNPPLYGVNWVSGLEISLRSISWIFTLIFFKDSEEINNQHFFSKIFKALFQNAYYLRYFYTKRSFNHTIGELFGAYLFFHIFDDYKKIKNWKQYFYKKLKTQIFLQVRQDGFNIEQSINYHKFVLEFFIIFLLLNKELIESPEGFLVNKMIINLSNIIKPNGTLPLVGDVDSGKVLLLTCHDDKSHLELVNLGCNFFKLNNLEQCDRKFSPISLLLMGSEVNSEKTLDSIESKGSVRYYENSGYFVLRNGWGKHSSYLFAHLGNFGPRNAPHSHSGISNIIFSYNGKDILVDSGTKSYNISMKERNYYRSSKAHNILSVDNQNQAKPLGWFTWDQQPKTSKKILINNDSVQISSNHDGYTGFLVQRVILASKNLKSIVIKDKIQPETGKMDNKEHKIELYYHFARGVSLDVDFQGKNSILINNEIILNISSDSNVKYKLESGEIASKYGEIHQISVLNIYVIENFSEKNNVSITTEFRDINLHD